MRCRQHLLLNRDVFENVTIRSGRQKELIDSKMLVRIGYQYFWDADVGFFGIAF